MEAVKFFQRQLLAADFPVPSADLTSQTCIVTGSNVGLGLETVAHFMRMNASKIIMGCRNTSKAEEARNSLLQRFPEYKGKLVVEQVDMASFDSVKSFVKKMEREERLDIVVLNAGINSPKWEVTNDGYEQTLQVNSIATGLLALLLLPIIKESGKKTGLKPRLCLVASDVHFFASFKERSAANIIEELNTKEKFNANDRYNVSKLLDVYIVREMANLSAAKGMVINAPNPCLCQSELGRDFPWILRKALNAFAFTTEKGARCFAYAAVDPDVPSGSFIQLGQPVAPSTPNVLSEEGQKAQKQVWGELKAIWIKLEPSLASVLQ